MALLDTTFVHFVVILLALVLLENTRHVYAQEDDFSSPIKCYTCEGAAEGSECSDPLDIEMMNTSYKMCEQGICLKWTKYKDRQLQMVRTCSIDIDFRLTMIDGVCRTERNGNGYLCMCGKNLCNGSPGIFRGPGGTSLLSKLSALFPALIMALTAYLVSSSQGSSWMIRWPPAADCGLGTT